MPSHNPEQEEEDAFVRTSHGLPLQHKLDAMSFFDLARLISTVKADSPAYMVVERAMKRILAEDQAKINRLNVLLGALIGGLFGFSGVVLGAYLKNAPAAQQPTPSSTVQQIQQGNLAVKPQITNVPSGQFVASQPIPVPANVKHDAQASQRRP